MQHNNGANSCQIDRIIDLANQYPDIVFAVSTGNEARVEWSDHLVPMDRLIGFARRVKASVNQPITFCENYLPWVGKLEPLAAELDFISLHSYPVWERRFVEDAFAFTKKNFKSVANHYPDKPMVITEVGWTTNANDRGIDE